MSKRIYGYMRVSTGKLDQTTDRQRLEFQKYSNKNNFKFHSVEEERVSGNVKAMNRPVYSSLKSQLRDGDTLIIEALDRLGRDASDIQSEMRDLEGLGVKVVILNMPYLNDWDRIQDDSMYRMFRDILITLQAHMAEQEREETVRRINQGLDVARSKGVRLGRPRSILSDEFIKEYEKYLDGYYGKMTKTDFSKILGIGRSTLYKYIELYDDNQNKK